MSTLAMELFVGKWGLQAMAWNICSSADVWKSKFGTCMVILGWEDVQEDGLCESWT